MNIKKIIRRNKTEEVLENYIQGDKFIDNIKTKDILVFDCIKCGKESNRESKKFILPLTENSFLCSNCQREITNLKKYGCKSALQSETGREKTKKTNLEKYGVENAFQSKEVQEKFKQTSLKRYGVERACASKEVRGKAKQTTLERFGVEHAFQSEEIKEKIKNDNLEKYGVEHNSQREDVKESIRKSLEEKYGGHPLQNEEVKEKVKKTNLEKYGVENVFQNKEIQEKYKSSMIEKYGVDNPNKLKEVRDKIDSTNLEKYGVKSPLQNKEVLNKLKETNLDRYGFISPLQNKEIKEKAINSLYDNYGVKSPLQNKEIKEKALKTNLEKYKNEIPAKLEEFKEKTRLSIFKKIYYNLLERNKNLVEPLFNLEQYDGRMYENKYEWKCLKCGNIFKDHLYSGHIPRCKICFPITTGYSNKEKEVAEFVKSLAFEIIENYRLENKELDVFIPSLNFGIEFDGIYWHSDEYKNELYHYHKTKFFKERNIDIIHIFEDEWDNKQEIVKSIIKSRLNKFDRIIYARKCIVKIPTTEEERNFLNDNHIQGFVPSKHCVGLYYEDELVSLMSFGYSRFNKNYEWELLRFVNKLNTKIIGGASKLFSNSGINYNIISYCDRRYFTGEIYKVLGFNLIGKSKPNYYYVKDNNRYSRIKFQKHKLKDLLENFDEELTENENMYRNGYNKIYDCGMLVFGKDNNNL